MNQCVPSWGIDNNHTTPPPKLFLRSHSNNSTAAPDVPLLDYEVAELTWKNGQLAMHGLGPPRVPPKPINPPSSKYSWDKPRAGGTLESIVNEATRHHPPQPKLPSTFQASVLDDEVVPWFHHQRPASAAASATMTMDALVPCSNRTEEPDAAPVVFGGSTRVGSCSGARDGDGVLGGKRARVAQEGSGRGEGSMSGSAATYGRDSQQVTADTWERELGVGMTSTSFGSQENTSSGKPGTMTAATADENDSVSHSRPQSKEARDEEDKKKVGKSSVSTKRSRAAAIHNQSERKRRDKINQRMKTLQKLVPNSSKTDKASMLDEVIEYLKQLQAQVQMMSRMNMQPMMLPMAMQQQLQMSMMTPMSMAGMGMGMGMGMGVMDITSMGCPNMTNISPVLHPSAFMSMASWDGSADRLQAASVSAMMPPDPLSAFLACQSQPMSMDAYSRMAAAMYQQLQQQPPASSSKS